MGGWACGGQIFRKLHNDETPERVNCENPGLVEGDGIYVNERLRDENQEGGTEGPGGGKPKCEALGLS